MLASGAAAPALARLPSGARDAIDWRRFLSRHDMVWDRFPTAWDEGPFFGNGLIGALLFLDQSEGALRLEIFRSDVQDHRTPIRQTGIGRGRLRIGYFLLRTRGRPIGKVALRLVLHDAMLTGTFATSSGSVRLRLYVHADDAAVVADADPSGGETCRWEWVGEAADSPRQQWAIQTGDRRAFDPAYRSNPAGRRSRDGMEELWLQPLLAGGGTATAWRGDAGKLRASIAHGGNLPEATDEALGVVRRIADDPTREARHRAWWHAYYPQSFVSLTDTRIESFYWIQMYKLASATRSDRPYIDNQGPWVQLSSWPYATWNLNVQLSYWPAITANRGHLAGSLVEAIRRGQAQLIENVAPRYRSDSAAIGRSAGRDLAAPVDPPRNNGKTGAGRREADWPPEMGNLAWALHDVWLAWRHGMDDSILRDPLFPMLRRTTNYYRHFLTRDADGRLHMPPTYSPEYGAARDCNYDLALLRWSCAALIEIARRLGIDDPLVPTWQGILRDLVDYPQDQRGFMIGADVPLAASHRHYSHLLMIYPLYLVNRDDPAAVAVIRRSLEHWQSMPEKLRGYSSTGAASIYAALGMGDRALAKFTELFDRYLRPNTFYSESGPVIETPLSGAQSIHDMLLQSWGGIIRPFPAMPSAWPDCDYEHLSAEGGFLVSASRRGGMTRWVEVTSRAGEPFALRTDVPDPVVRMNGRTLPLETDGAGVARLPLRRNETIMIFRRGHEPAHGARPVRAGLRNSFGLNARNAIKNVRDWRITDG